MRARTETSNRASSVRLPLFSLFILLLPLIEIAGFVLVGRQIGVLSTVGLVLLSGVAGLVLLRYQGLGVMARLNAAVRQGTDPGRELAHGAMILLAGFLLLVPGFLTDIIGLLLFIPPVRDLGWKLLRGRLAASGGFMVFRGGARAGPRGAQRGTIDLDEDDYSVQRPPKPTQPRPSLPRTDEDR
jgi:UPF0716 protein FxsA